MASRREPVRAYRIADSRHRIFDGLGAMLRGARWNSPGRRVIYASLTYSGALLEVLVHASGAVPRSHRYVEIEIPAKVKVERVNGADLPGWDEPGSGVAREFGDRWYDERRSAVLVVPSVVTRMEGNVLINPEHGDFGLIRAGSAQAVYWDERLWVRG